MKPIYSRVICSIFALITLSPLAFAAVGGGYTDNGLEGAYFANPDLEGEPHFRRREVRINFDWGANQPVGGSRSKPYCLFPTSNFSVRWTGQIIPRFSEIYTFKSKADDGIRILLKTPEAQKWQTLIDAWDRPGESTVMTGALTAGKIYDIRIEYHKLKGKGVCRVLWSSPSTPEEVIDPVTGQGVMVGCLYWADLVKHMTWRSKEKESEDENGFPARDGMLSARGDGLTGTYLLAFGGKADVVLKGAVFVAGDREFKDTLPAGTGYDPAANRTAALTKIAEDKGQLILTFRNTSRDGSGRTNTGLSYVRFMRPVEPGSDTPHREDELCYRPIKENFSHTFSAIRWCTRSLCYNSGKWKDRKVPSDRHPGQEGWGFGRSDCFESMVMWSNETGRDILMSTSSTIDDEHFEKLAKLLKYGSDGREPYGSPQEHPLFPPLNPNLRVYIEFGNEIWNWASPVTRNMMKMMDEEKEAGTEDGKAFNYNSRGNYRTWLALRTVRGSSIFRRVFGDAAMGETVRFIIEYQYANTNNTAKMSFEFIDNYFNNGDGEHVKDPHPVNYYVWGGGGGAYYGVGNPMGCQEKIRIPDHSFENHPVPNGTYDSPARPDAQAQSGWKFTGGAGIYRHLNQAVANAPDMKWISEFRRSKRHKLQANQWYGMRFEVGDRPIFVYQLGRYYNGARGQAAVRFLVIRADTKETVLEQEIKPLTGFPLGPCGFRFVPRSGAAPVKLPAGTEYYLLAGVKGGSGECFREYPASGGPGIAIKTSVQSVRARPDSSIADIKFEETQGSGIFGPVSFLYSFEDEAIAPVPPIKECLFVTPPDGQQAAVIRGKGEMSVTMDFPKDGSYALLFNACHGPGPDGKLRSNAYRVFFDDTPITPCSRSSHRITEKGTFPMMYGGGDGMFEEYGSGVFSAKAGAHSIRFAADGPEDRIVLIDNIRLSSVDAIMNSGFGSGSAMGQPVEHKWKEAQYFDTELCLTFGLQRVSYESGWSLGGDRDQMPIQNWTKFHETRTKALQARAFDIFMGSGAFLPFWGVYRYFPPEDPAGANTYPIMQSFIECTRRLPAEPDNGIALPAVLDLSNLAWIPPGSRYKPGKTLKSPGTWHAWVINCPATTEYRVKAETTAGGKFEIEADGRALGDRVESGRPDKAVYTVKLTRGAHGIRIRNREGSFDLERISVQAVQVP